MLDLLADIQVDSGHEHIQNDQVRLGVYNLGTSCETISGCVNVPLRMGISQNIADPANDILVVFDDQEANT